MLIPSIDLKDGHAVQLIGGKEPVLDAGDPRPIAEKFRLIGEVAVVDLNAALQSGDNAEAIRALLRIAPCRVGGGIRDAATALRWLDEGARRVVLGTAAVPEVLTRLPRERVIAALDAVHGEVVVDGWRRRTGRPVLARMRELRGLVGGFLVTFVEREGRMGGAALDQVADLLDAAGDARLTLAGGVSSAAEIATLDRMGVDAQVGMALYTGRLKPWEAVVALLPGEPPDGLWPTVVTDEHGVALGLCFSDRESLAAAMERGQGIYHSRSRGLWVKGESSGDTQELLRVALDCDRDALRFTVRQRGSGFCHLRNRTCWGREGGLPALARLLLSRRAAAPHGSYTQRLFHEPGLLGAKLREEAAELAAAVGRDEVIREAADVLYFTLARLARDGVELYEVEKELELRALRVSRRPGDRKPEPAPGPAGKTTEAV